MHTQFHINWIGKQLIIDQLGVACGLRKDVGTYVDGNRIERSEKNRRAVLLSLVKGGFIKREPGETQYTVLPNKVFEQIDAEEWLVDHYMVFPRTEGYGLRDLSVGLLKTILVNLVEGRAVAEKIQQSNDLVIKLTEEARTTDEEKAEQWVFDNLPSIAAHVLDLSEATAQLVSLRGKTVGHSLNELPLMVAEAMEENYKEINRLKMRREAFMMLEMRVEKAGGWDKFLAGCRALQKLQGLSAKYSEPGEGEAA